ncbi:hypothetical protein ACH4U6_35540 [Streptomyces netropsis]
MQQPACASCGASETHYVKAAAFGWQTIQHRLYCPSCAHRFPTWMHKQL